MHSVRTARETFLDVDLFEILFALRRSGFSFSADVVSHLQLLKPLTKAFRPHEVRAQQKRNTQNVQNMLTSVYLYGVAKRPAPRQIGANSRDVPVALSCGTSYSRILNRPLRQRFGRVEISVRRPEKSSNPLRPLGPPPTHPPSLRTRFRRVSERRQTPLASARDPFTTCTRPRNE